MSYPDRLPQETSATRSSGTATFNAENPTLPVPQEVAQGPTLRELVESEARKSGWREPEGRPRDGTLSKEMKLEFAGTVVEGTASVRWASITRHFDLVLNEEHGPRQHASISSAFLGWSSPDEAPHHPHDTGSYICFQQQIPQADIQRYSSQGILPKVIVGLVEGAYRAFNPRNLGNGDWRTCPFCRTCVYWQSHRCQRHALTRRSPTLARFETALLVGCGVTGSWALPVICRVAESVFVFDNDRVDTRNPHGRWSSARPLMNKIRAAVEPRYADSVTISSRRFSWSEPLPPAQLVVMTPDSARSRLNILQSDAFVSDTWIVDLRVADGQLNVWCFPGRETDMRQAWRNDLDTYIEEEEGRLQQGCLQHDNVPIVAGVMAAAFLSWWTTREPESGIWTVPLDAPWENMIVDLHQTRPSHVEEDEEEEYVEEDDANYISNNEDDFVASVDIAATAVAEREHEP